MSTEEARYLIGMEADATTEQLEQMYRQQHEGLKAMYERESLLGLKEEYRQELMQLDAAWKALTQDRVEEVVSTVGS